MKALALALDDKVLALALAPQVLALALALREKSWPWQGQDFFPKIQATWLLYVYALLTLTVSQQCAISCSGMFHRLACRPILDVGCKIMRICEVWAV